MNKIRYGSIISTLAWFFATAPVSAQDILKTGTQDFEARNGHAFGMCGNMKTLCGCVYAEGNSNDDFNEVKIYGKTTVETILKEIVRKNPRYQWIIADGVINILPKKEYQHLVNGKDPLDVIIDDFTIDEKEGVGRYMICDIKGLNCRTPREIVGFMGLCSPISLHLKKVTLREALNKIVKADGMASWTLEYGNDKQAAIDIRCWRPRPKLIEEDTATLKIMAGAQQQPVQHIAGETDRPALILYWALIVGLLILYFTLRAFRQVRNRPPK